MFAISRFSKLIADIALGHTRGTNHVHGEYRCHTCFSAMVRKVVSKVVKTNQLLPGKFAVTSIEGLRHLH
jgi:hypothetical protein